MLTAGHGRCIGCAAGTIGYSGCTIVCTGGNIGVLNSVLSVLEGTIGCTVGSIGVLDLVLRKTELRKTKFYFTVLHTIN